MKRLLFILVLLPSISEASNYYFSFATGDDSRTTTQAHNSATPWKTLAKLNSFFSSLVAGDSALLNRGETWSNDSIVINSVGSRASHIVIGAYGTGANPLITGFTTISGWTNEGGGIYSKAITSAALTNMVTIDGVQFGMGRTPNSGYYTYQSFSTNTSITSTSVPVGTADWTGAEAVIRKNDYTMDRCRITGHSSNTLTYTSLAGSANATAGYGFFIQNDLRCIDVLGEWYHNTSTGKFYMYFGAVDPTTKVVKVATINNLIFSGSGNNFITIDHITLNGSIADALDIDNTTKQCVIQYCNIQYSGKSGINLRFSCDSNTIINDTITTVNRTGINTDGFGEVISGNVIRNIGSIAGGPFDEGHSIGILSDDGGATIQSNVLSNIGFHGIRCDFNGPYLVQYNFVDSAVDVIDDGGGIYLATATSSVRVIDHNIVLDALGSIAGTTNSIPLAKGIYLDEGATNVVVTNNSTSNCSYNGIFLHKANTNTIKYNTIFNSNRTALFLQNDTGSPTIFSNVIIGNIFFAKTSTQLVVRFLSNTNDIPSFGTADSNYYCRPIDDNLTFEVNQPSIGDLTKNLTQWQSFTSQDAHSNITYSAVSDVSKIRFEYNATSSPTSVSLAPLQYRDVSGNAYSGTITLPAFSSLILLNGVSLSNGGMVIPRKVKNN